MRTWEIQTWPKPDNTWFVKPSLVQLNIYYPGGKSQLLRALPSVYRNGKPTFNSKEPSAMPKGNYIHGVPLKKLPENNSRSLVPMLVQILTLMWIPRLRLILIRTLILKQYPASGVSLATSAYFKFKFWGQKANITKKSSKEIFRPYTWAQNYALNYAIEAQIV